MMFPLLDWLQILPGDAPPCFLCCIQVLLQCMGMPFSDIPQCGGLYNIDTLLRALADPALLVFLGLSMVPGLCNYVPFIINMWMIPPPVMPEEEKMMRKSPALKALLKASQNEDVVDSLGECDKEKKSEENEKSPFEDGVEDLDKKNIEEGLRNENGELPRNYGDFSDGNEKISSEPSDFPARYIMVNHLKLFFYSLLIKFHLLKIMELLCIFFYLTKSLNNHI
jgi:hypothetical protein